MCQLIKHTQVHANTHTHIHAHTHTTHTHTHTHTHVYKQHLTTQQMPPSPAPIMASTMTRAVSPTASGMYWALWTAAGRRGEDDMRGWGEAGRERREV